MTPQSHTMPFRRELFWTLTIIAVIAGALPTSRTEARRQAPAPDSRALTIVRAACTQCHDMDRVSSAGRSRVAWEGIVREMMGMGAAVPPDQASAVVDYLATQFPEGMKPAAREFALETSEYRVAVMARNLEYPWSMAFLPGGDILITERTAARLRLFRNGVLKPTPVAGLPPIYSGGQKSGLQDIVLHPKFAENKWLYLAYSKPLPDLPQGEPPLLTNLPTGEIATGGQRITRKTTGRRTTEALLRARWDGEKLTEVKEIFVSNNVVDDSISQTSPQRLVFGTDGMLYMSTGARAAPAGSGPYSHALGGRAQDPMSHGGKILRLRDDGTVPPDNPFVGRPGYAPEIYTFGHRNVLGLAVHPTTGEIWEHENGPLDGDEVNILKAGKNYGWPITGMGRDYSGDFIGGAGAVGEEAGRADAGRYYVEGFEQPVIFWVPTAAPSGMAFYTGDEFPQWKGNLFIGTLKNMKLERHIFNARGYAVRRQYLLEDLKQRIRDVRQGPDGLLYVLTDENPGVMLRLEPVAKKP